MKGETEIQMTDRIGDLSPEQVSFLALGLEHAHGMTLRPAWAGRYWLEDLEDGGAILIKPDRTVERVWQFAESVAEAQTAFKDGKVLEWLEKRQ